VLEVKFLYHPSETQRITIRPDGTLPLSITGDLDVNRLTVDEAEDLIRARASKFLRDPVVSVTVVESGARAYILKGVAARELLRILRAVAAGESYVPPALAASLLLEMHEPGIQARQPANPINELTGREREILEGLAAGLSNKEIGQKLFLSEKTVKHYMTNILQKLQVRNRVEAALLAQRSGKVEKPR
jgi:DNA-binding NarL/FixJ family response regulator